MNRMGEHWVMFALIAGGIAAAVLPVPIGFARRPRRPSVGGLAAIRRPARPGAGAISCLGGVAAVAPLSC